MNIDRSLFEIKPNAQKAEIFAYFLLKDSVFLNKKTIIGDELKHPDLYTQDDFVGVEVVCCENPSIFFKHENILNNEAVVFDETLLKFVNKSAINSNRYSLGMKYKFGSTFYTSPASQKKLDERKKVYIERLRYNLENKHKKLNRGNYSACAHRNLFIFSDYSKKNYISLDEIIDICQDVRKDYDKTFDNIYIAFNNNLNEIHRDGTTKLIRGEKSMGRNKHKFDYEFYPS